MAEEQEFTPPEMCKTNLLDLCNEVVRILDGLYKEKKIDFNPVLVSFGQGLLSKYEPDVIMDNFIKNTYEHWPKIEQKDENFFLDNATDLLKDYPVGDLNPFKQIFINDDIDDDDKELLWEYFDSLVKIAIIHIHEQRKPFYIINEDGNKKKSYSKDHQYQPQVGIVKMANLFQIKLEWPED